MPDVTAATGKVIASLTRRRRGILPPHMSNVLSRLYFVAYGT
jgi:hypothetical protein